MIKQVQSGVEKNLKGMIDRGQAMRGFLDRVTYPQYQKLQMQRWKTENSSEGSKWKKLHPVYAEYKKRRYGGGPKYQWIGGQGDGRPWKRIGRWPNYPGSGTKMMIATGRLVSSVVGPVKGATAFPMKDAAKDHRKIVTNRSLEVYTVVEYAEDAARLRPYMHFSRRHMKEMRDAALRYLATGKDRGDR